MYMLIILKYIKKKKVYKNRFTGLTYRIFETEKLFFPRERFGENFKFQISSNQFLKNEEVVYIIALLLVLFLFLLLILIWFG